MASLSLEELGEPLQVRIAANTGVAVTGDVGSSKRREYTVLGDVVNTASRVQSTVARPGQVLITRATYEPVHNNVRARSLGAFDVRGRSAPVEVFEVEDVTPW